MSQPQGLPQQPLNVRNAPVGVPTTLGVSPTPQQPQIRPAPVQQPTMTPTVQPANPQPQISSTVGAPPTQSPTDYPKISADIGTARQRGADDNTILQTLIQKQPSLQTDAQTAIQRGATPSQILDTIQQKYAPPDPNQKPPGYNNPLTIDQASNEEKVGLLKSLGSTGTGLLKLSGKIGNAIQGKGFQLQVDPTSLIGRADAALAPKNSAQAFGKNVGNVAQFFAPGIGEEEAATNAATKAADLFNFGSKATKAVQLGTEGVLSGAKNFALAQAQGQSNKDSALIGGISAVSPTLAEGVKGAAPILKDFLGGEGTADAMKVKDANPDLVKAWQTGQKDVNSLAGDITSTVKNYQTEGKTALQTMKNNLPDVAMPATNIKGGITDLISTASDSNLTAEEERTLSKLQSYVDKNVGNDTTVKGVLDLKTGLDNGNFYKAGDPSYNNSNKVVSQVRQYLNNLSIERMTNYDTQHGTQFADQIKSGLADATDRINFLDKVKANLLGRNPETYVEQTTNKVRSLINKSGDPSLAENTKDLVHELGQRTGKDFTTEFQAAHAAKALKGNLGRMVIKGTEAAIGGGLITELGKTVFGKR